MSLSSPKLVMNSTTAGADDPGDLDLDRDDDILQHTVTDCQPTTGNRPVGHLYRSSAAAETGDRLATIDMGRKVSGAVPLSVGSWVPI